MVRHVSGVEGAAGRGLKRQGVRGKGEMRWKRQKRGWKRERKVRRKDKEIPKMCVMKAAKRETVRRKKKYRDEMKGIRMEDGKGKKEREKRE